MKFFYTTVVLILSTLFSNYAQAQTPSWQWGRRGGSNESNLNEPIRGIATDPNGNVYILSHANYSAGGSATLDVAGNAIVGKGNLDVILSSFTCSGVYRWSRVFGGALVDDYAFDLQSDTLGGIYFTGRFNNLNSSIALASDTILTTQSGRSLYLIKYDTSGNYKWVVRPQSDTTSAVDNSNSRGLQVDGGGNVYWLAHLLPNAYSNSAFQVNNYSLNVLKYNKNGVFQGGIPMDIVSNVIPVYYQSMLFTRSKTGRFYLSGEARPSGTTSLSFGSTNITKQMFVGAFSSNGTSLWTKQSSFDRGALKNSGMDRVSLDDSGNVYVAANCSHGDAFAGSALLLNTVAGIEEMVFAAKLDSNGNLKWIKNSNNAGSYVQDSRAALTSDGKFVVAAGLLGTVSWPGLSNSIKSTDGATASRDFLITRIEGATGQVLSMDTLESVGPTSNVPDIAYADKKGNVYFGGQMDRGVVIAGTTLNAAGSTSTDFFLAKYGYANCNCVVPVAAITQSSYDNAARSAAFQYTGTTAGIDSIVFVWGNGLRLRLTNNFNAIVTQYYGTNANTFNVCVTAYTNGCGNNTACRTLQFTPVGIEQVVAAGGASLQLAPNPAAGATEVSYILQGNSGSLEVYDLAGRLLSTKALRQKAGTETVALTEFAAGVYVVVLREEGRVMQQQRLVISK